MSQELERFDPSILGHMINDNQELFAEVLDMFESQGRFHLDGLETAAAQAQHEEMRYHAHSLKGMAANIGAGTLRQLATQAETLVKQSAAPGEILPLCAAVRQEFEALLLLLKQQPSASAFKPAI